MKDNRIVIVGLVIVVLVAGIAFVFLGGTNKAEVQSVITVPEGETVEEAVPSTQEAAVVAAPATNTADSETMVPTPRADLYATDPGTVNLISGKVQFVEAFAFW